MTAEQYLAYLNKKAKDPNAYCSIPETKRKMASVQVISKIEPIEKDNEEVNA